MNFDEMQELFYVILFVEAQIIGLFILVLIILNIADWIGKILYPVYPHCDIDPRCHLQFFWDEHGNGYIGKYLVIPRS